MSNESVARAFSGHQFAETYDHLAEDIVWNLVGQARIHGRDAVIETCEATLRDLAETTTSWSRFVVTPDGPVVAVDSIGRYFGPEGESAVSSCDIYEFVDGRIQTITSYFVELDHDGADGAED
jgi:ketosteroid isomerase-like protein